jgi:hypothetical protein
MGLGILLINLGYTSVCTVILNWLVDMFCSNVNVLYGLGYADVECLRTFRPTLQLPSSGSVTLGGFWRLMHSSRS